jgi:hypothetical protein
LTGIAKQHVIALATLRPVVAITANDDIVSLVAMKVVIAFVALDLVVPNPAKRRVVTGTADKKIVIQEISKNTAEVGCVSAEIEIALPDASWVSPQKVRPTAAIEGVAAGAAI